MILLITFDIYRKPKFDISGRFDISTGAMRRQRLYYASLGADRYV